MTALETQYTGSVVGSYTKLNFSGSGVNVFDDVSNGRTNVVIPGVAIYDETNFLTASATAISFRGSMVSASLDTARNRVNVTFTGSIGVQDEGSFVATRPTINFTGTGITATDDVGNNRINVDVTSGELSVQDEGSTVGTQPALNFIGTGVNAVNDTGNNRVNVTIPGLEVQDEASVLSTNPGKLRFTGVGVTATYNGGADRVDVSIPGTQLAIQDEGTPVQTVSTINFTGPGVTASYDSLNQRINVDVQVAGSASAVSFYDEGSFVNARSTVNFTGASVTVTDDGPNNRINVDINAAGGGSQLAGDVGAYRNATSLGSIPSFIEPDNGWDIEVNTQPGTSPIMYLYQNLIFFADRDPNSDYTNLQCFGQDGIHQNGIIDILTASSANPVDLVVFADRYDNGSYVEERHFGVVTTTSGVYMANFRLGNYSNSPSVVVSFYGLSTFDLCSGSGGRVTVVDSTSPRYVWSTSPTTNELVWFESPNFDNWGVINSGLASPATAITFASKYGLIVTTATGIYKIPVNGNGLGSPTLITALSDVVDIKFDGQRLLAVKPGSVRAIDPETGTTIFTKTNAAIDSMSRLSTSKHGLYTITLAGEEKPVLVFDTFGTNVSEITNTYLSGGYGDGYYNDLRAHKAVITDDGFVAWSATAKFIPEEFITSNNFSDQFGMGLTTGSINAPHSFVGNGNIYSSDNSYFNNSPLNYDIRIKRWWVRHTVNAQASDNGLFFNLGFSDGFFNYPAIPSASIALDDSLGEHFYEERNLNIYVEGASYWAIGVDHDPRNPGGSVNFDYGFFWAINYEIVNHFNDVSTVSTLPYVVNDSFLVTQPLVVSEVEVKLNVNTVLNGTDDIEIRVLRNGSLVGSGSFQETSGEIIVSVPVNDFGAEIVPDVFSIEIDNLTNPGSSCDYTLVHERLFWAGTTANLDGGTYFSSTRTMTHAEFSYKPAVSSSMPKTYELQLYINDILHHTTSFTENSVGQKHMLQYALPVPLTLQFFDTIDWKVVSKDIYEPWHLAWPQGGNYPDYDFHWALSSSLPPTTQTYAFTTRDPFIERARTVYASRLRIGSPANGSGQYLSLTSNGYVTTVSPPSNAPTVTIYQADYTFGPMPAYERNYLRTADATGPFTLNLPFGFSLAAGTRIYFKDVQGNASVNTVTLVPYSGHYIEGSTDPIVIDTDWGDLTLEWAGTYPGGITGRWMKVS